MEDKMSRLIPAKIRAEGIELYQKNQVNDIVITDLKMMADVSGEQVVYDLDGNSDSCFCEEFIKTRRYCKHIAAIEEYLRYEAAGRNEVNELQAQQQMVREKSIEFQAAADFLARINRDLTTSVTQSFTLAVDIVDAANSDEFISKGDFFVVTLRVCIGDTGRGYIIRDIPNFLKAVKQGNSVTLGHFYFSQVLISDFDRAGRDVLDFLLRLQIDDKLMQGTLYRKSGRYFIIPYIFVKKFLDLVENLEEYKMKIAGKKVNYWTFVALNKQANIYQFIIKPLDDSIQLIVHETETFSLYDGRLLYFENIFYMLTDEQVRLLRNLSINVKSDSNISMDITVPEISLHFSYDEKDALAQALQEFEKLGLVVSPEAFKIRDFKPSFYFSINADVQEMQLDVQFNYGNFNVAHFRDLETLEFSRNLRLEKKIFDLIERSGFPKSFKGRRAILTRDELYNFYELILPAFELLGTVTLDESLSTQQIIAEPEIFVSTRGNLLDISFNLPEIETDEFAAIVEKLSTNKKYYITKSGKLIKLDERFTKMKQALKDLSDVTIMENCLVTPTYHALEISKIFENTADGTFDEKFQQLYRDLTEPQNFAYKKSEKLAIALRSYQEDGVRWLNMLTHYNMGGILADDMGLGKTLQAIAYLLSSLAEEETALIVAPSSLLYNWQDEFNKFAPNGLDVQVVDGTKEIRDGIINEFHQVYITSYGSFLKDASVYENKNLDTLFLDEAQVVKNFNSKTNKALSTLTVAHIFALSGTPIENKLDEIWAIFNILMPGFLPTRKIFNKLLPEQVLRKISPFILRRKKEEVLTELPEKLEMTQLSELTDGQKLIYLAQLDQMQQRVLTMTQAEFSRHRIEILAGITRLRQICDTPALFIDDYKEGSGKLKSLFQLLQQVKDSGRRPLIFSQFTKVFPHIEKILDDLGLTSYKLTGSTPSRERIEMVRAFNSGSRDVFLISLKAGGVGLNLASSDMVILVDLWWNPAVEEQAISRAHRMGQKNMVEVVRLITKGTIEEKIIEIQKRKKNLFTAILDNSESRQSLSQMDINEILGINS